MKRRAFTLIELLIVIALIGILISIAAVSYSSAQKKARDSRRMTDLRNLQNAMEQYYADHNQYPAAASACDPGTTYLPGGFPTDPISTNLYAKVTCTTASYCVCSVALEGGAVGNSAGQACPFTAGTKNYYCVASQQ